MKKAIFFLISVFLFINIYAEKLDVKGQISDEFKQIQKDSEDYRINKDSVKLMVRKNGLGKELITQKLIEKFKTGDTINTKTSGNWEMNLKDDFNSVVGDGWDLTVFGDGTRVNYRNWKYVLENKAKYGKAKAMSLTELKTAGEKFIKGELKDFVKLGVGEELVFMQSKYEVDIVGSDDGSFYDETLGANIAYFGRKKDSLMFVGNSSMIIVEFSNDRKPVSFYYKWKDYEELEDQINIASREEINYRISSFSSMNFGNVKNLDVKLICGIYDDSEYVQPACEVKQKGETDNGSFGGIINIIPAGKNHAEGGNWGELKMLNSYGEICRESDITGEIFPENEK